MLEIIKIEHYSTEKLEEQGITSWPVWTKEISRFDWSYDSPETCYIFEGKATIESEGETPILIKSGDKVIFPQGLKCVWDIKVPIRKYYNFG